MDGGAGEFIETERKYEAEASFVLPSLTGLDGVAAVSPPRTHELSAVYYDTADLRLLGAKITLRRRTGGSDAGWHLKLPAGADTRREIHAPLGSGGQGVPAELADRVSGWAGDQPLQPIARLETTRTVQYLTSQGGEVLAEVADDLVTGSLPEPRPAAWRVAANWREIEVELGAGGSPVLLDAVAAALRQAGARPSASPSKLARLLGAGPVRKG